MLDGHGDDLYRYRQITMNFSSNIYPAPNLKELEEHLCRHIGLIRHYPAPTPTRLEQMIAADFDVDANEVMVTSGATDAIYLIAQTFSHEKTFATNHPTFSEYDDASLIAGMSECDPSAEAGLFWVCNPNNPTGEVRTNDAILVLAHNHHLLVVDQSYEDYTQQPLMTAAEAIRHKNIIQSRSLTKRYAIPGLRLGFITADHLLIERLKSNYRPWAVNALAIEAGCWLLSHHPKVCATDIADYLDEAQRLRTRLNQIPGITALPTHTNFMLCTIQNHTAKALKDYLAHKEGILIRDASNFRGLTPHHFRVAAQSPTENDALVNAINQFISLCPPSHSS